MFEMNRFPIQPIVREILTLKLDFKIKMKNNN